MGETTLAEVATTVRHQGETLVRLERKIDSNHVSLENKGSYHPECRKPA